MKKKICIISTMIVLALAVAGMFLAKKETFSLIINESNIDKEEFLEAANAEKYDVIKYFSMKGAGNVDAEFWEREADGEVPYEKLADAAIERLKRVHAIYDMAKEKGYIDGTSYQDLVSRWKAENQARKDKIAKGEPVYGLSEYSLELYQEYEIDTFQKRYCEDLENEGMAITDEERQAYYEATKELYQRDDDRVLDYIKIPYEMEGMTGEQVDEWKSRLVKLYKNMDETHSLANLAGEDAKLRPYLIHEEVTADELSFYSKTISDILEYAWELKTGESTAVLDEGGCLYLIECTKRTENGAAQLDTIKDNINKKMREERYEEMIAQRAADAQVDGDMDSIYFFMKKSI